MSLKRSKSRLAKTIGLDQKAKNTRSRSKERSNSQKLPSSDLKEDRGRLKITREGNEQRTFTPARDAERHEAVERAAAEHGLTSS
jgi:hypothetical protein